MMAARSELTDADYAALANFRYALRQFLAFSERRAAECGLTPQQHQALLAIRGATQSPVTVGYVAERLALKPHSATGLIDRLEAIGHAPTFARRWPSGPIAADRKSGNAPVSIIGGASGGDRAPSPPVDRVARAH